MAARSRATRAWSASPTSRRTRSATSSSSSCPRSATTLDAGAGLRRGRVEQDGVRPLRARSRARCSAVNEALRERAGAGERDPYGDGVDDPHRASRRRDEVDGAARRRRAYRALRRERAGRSERVHARIPPADVAAMLAAIGVERRSTSSSRTCPRRCAHARAHRPARRADASRSCARASRRWRRATRRVGARVVPRRRRLSALRPGRRRPDPAALGVRDRLHAVPARGEPGDAAGDLRVPDLRGACCSGSTSPTPACTTARRRPPRPC